MDFAKKQLMKFGWTEGKGLGKNENGISEALKPTLKFDTTGVGHDSSEQFTYNWWENVFNNAADNIKVSKSDGEVKIDLNSEESVNITTKKYIIKDKMNKGLEYGCFLKTSKLTQDGVVDHEDKQPCVAEDIVLKISTLTDEELFAACGKRTAHKGARHGLKLSGKLSRIEQQEKELASLLKNRINSSIEFNKKMMETTQKIFEDYDKIDTDANKKIKPKTKKKNKVTKEIENLEVESDSCLEVKKNTKKIGRIEEKKRKRECTNSDEESGVEIDLETAEKRQENFCNRINYRKEKKRHKKEEKKLLSMLENFNIKNKSSKKEKSKELDSNELKIIMKKKSKKKLNKKYKEDSAFSELITEISGKLQESKEKQKKFRQKQKNFEKATVSKVSDIFDKLRTS